MTALALVTEGSFEAPDIFKHSRRGPSAQAGGTVATRQSSNDKE